MKMTLAILLGLFSLSALSSTELSYQTNIKVNKTVMDKDILLKTLIKLRIHLEFESREMIAVRKLEGSKKLVRL